MQLVVQVIATEKAKSVTDIRNITEKWDSRVLMLQRDFDEKVNSKMKAAILISIPPTDLRDSLIQQADKFVEYQPTEEKGIAIVEAKMAMRSPHEMDVDELTWWNANEENENEDIQSLGRGGIHCYGCGGPRTRGVKVWHSRAPERQGQGLPRQDRQGRQGRQG